MHRFITGVDSAGGESPAAPMPHTEVPQTHRPHRVPRKPDRNQEPSAHTHESSESSWREFIRQELLKDARVRVFGGPVGCV